MKRSALKPSRKPMKRSPLNRAGALRPMSVKYALEVAEAKESRRDYLLEHNFCEARAAGAPGDCFGELHVHETLPRGRGGKITDRSLFKSVCDFHNERISMDVATMRWAESAGFLEHSRRRIE